MGTWHKNRRQKTEFAGTECLSSVKMLLFFMLQGTLRFLPSTLLPAGKPLEAMLASPSESHTVPRGDRGACSGE